MQFFKTMFGLAVMIGGAAIGQPHQSHEENMSSELSPLTEQANKRQDQIAQDHWPQIVVTNPPLHSLVWSIMGQNATPVLLFGSQTSHHHTALKPSQLRQMAQADLLVWSGVQIESPISVVLQKQIIAVDHWSSQLCQGQRALPMGSDQAGTDPHGWLDIDNAVCYVNELVDKLMTIDPGRRLRYRSNATELITQLKQLDNQLAQGFEMVDGEYMAYHNSFRYLLSRYGLTAKAELNLFNEQPPGLRRLLKFRQQLKSSAVGCLIADSSASRHQLEQWQSGSSARLLMLDPMGRDIEPGPALYFQLLTGLSEQMMSCIGG
ncbi:MAG: zinc ABC transporter substrate-binding protein [Immundisolibacteraceae bacterium]|nr:zinc ABC transporter substrate-binding protein [Immundisolibacteraceae bacterium]